MNARLIVALVASLGLVGCGGIRPESSAPIATEAATASAAAMPTPTASEQPSLGPTTAPSRPVEASSTPEPTPAPLLTMEQARAAASTYQHTFDAAGEDVHAKYSGHPCAFTGKTSNLACDITDIEPGAEYWSENAALFSQYAASLAEFQWPAVSEQAVNRLIDALDEARAAGLSVAATKTLTAFRSKVIEAVEKRDSVWDAEQEFLDSLGLPVGP